MEKLTDNGFVTIVNDDGDIAETNYFDLDHAAKGMLFFSVNRGCIRMLIPATQDIILKEITPCKEIIISRGPFHTQGVDDAFEIFFDDKTDSSFVINASIDQWDVMPNPGFSYQFSAWKAAGKVYSCERCFVRQVESLPCLQSLSLMDQRFYIRSMRRNFNANPLFFTTID